MNRDYTAEGSTIINGQDGTDDIIRELGHAINGAGGWGLNEFLVFLVLIFVALILIIFYFSQRSSAKMTDLVIRANEKNNEVVNNNTFAMRNLAEKMRDNHNANNKKLNEIHDDVKEIKDRLK